MTSTKEWLEKQTAGLDPAAALERLDHLEAAARLHGDRDLAQEIAAEISRRVSPSR